MDISTDIKTRTFGVEIEMCNLDRSKVSLPTGYSWSKDEDGDNVKALNYWWGMSAGVVDLIYSESLPSATKRLVKLFEKELKEARFRVFEGELKDQQGNIRVEEGKLIDPEHIITMDWLLDNVVGRLPRYDELTDNAKLKMALQGVVKEEE